MHLICGLSWSFRMPGHGEYSDSYPTGVFAYHRRHSFTQPSPGSPCVAGAYVQLPQAASALER